MRIIPIIMYHFTTQFNVCTCAYKNNLCEEVADRKICVLKKVVKTKTSSSK